jgi:flagellar motor component MotA
VILKEMMLEGTLGILEGQNPRIIEAKLSSFIEEKWQKLRQQSSERKPKAAA